MFARNIPPKDQPAARSTSPATTSATKPTTSMIGANVQIIGNSTVECQSQIQIDGIIDGEIKGKEVMIGKNAQITGKIDAQAIDIRGLVEGTLQGKSITLQNTARVNGEIHHETIAIIEGAVFEGRAHPATNAQDRIQNFDLSQQSSSAAESP